MNCLPDDVLSKVFSLLPPVMLLDSVPLVCKRWHQLSKQPDSWRNFNLTFPSDASKKQLGELSRFAKAAPYINCLDFSDIEALNPQLSSIVYSLINEHKIIKILHTMETSTKKMRAFNKSMLQKFTPSLREVFIPLVSPDSISEEYHANINKMLTLVSEIPHLQSLGFKRIAVEEFKNYKGQLGKGCPSLKKFVLQSRFKATGVWNCLIFDVLKSKKDLLQEIDFEIVCEPVEKFMAAIRGCHNVETLKVPIGILPVVDHMSKLRSLGLYFTWFFDSFLITPLPELMKFIDESPVIENITELTLSCSHHCRWLPEYNATVNQSLEALAKRSKGIQVFRINNLRVKERVLNLFFSQMKNVHTIILHKCSESILGNHINIDPKNKKYVIIEDFRVNSKSAQEEFENIVQKLQSSQPQLVMVFSCRIVDYDESDKSGSSDESDDDSNFDDYDYYDDEYEFTYFDYLRNRYGEDLSDSELYAFMSSDED